MLLLPRWICSSQYRPRLTEAELQLPKQSLALAHTQLDSIGLVDPGRQALAIPKLHPHARVAWFGAQHPIDFLHLLFVQSAGAARAFPLRQTSQPFLLEAVNPILDRTRRITQQASNLRACQTLRHQQHTVQPVVVARLLRPLNFLLQTEHRSGSGNREWSHDSSRPRLNNMRNYL